MIALCLTVTAAGAALDQTNICYAPEIIMNRITPASVLFYFAYGTFLFLPMILQIAGERKFRKDRFRSAYLT